MYRVLSERFEWVKLAFESEKEEDDSTPRDAIELKDWA